MLGGSDDLGAITALLDRVSEELAGNREVLDKVCATADSISGGTNWELPNESSDLPTSKLTKAFNDAIDESCTQLHEVLLMLRKQSQAQDLALAEAHSQQRSVLLHWRSAAEKLASEIAEIESQDREFDRKLCKFIAL